MSENSVDVASRAVSAGPYAGGVRLAELVRSGFVESVHTGSVAILDASGNLVEAVGDPHGAVFPRSANKLMQATGMLEAGFVPRDDAELALAAASHHGEPFHVAGVLAMLERAELPTDALACPADLPLAADARAAVLRTGGGPERVFMNCSGKHAAMLLTCRAAGWPIHGYTSPDHPLQRTLRETVERLAGEPAAAVGVDGCGAPVLALSLTGLARAFLVAVETAPGSPARRVADAMRAHPEVVSGTGADDARLMWAVPGLLSKGGAEGVAAVAIPGVGAIALKIDDGADRARQPVLAAALRRLGISGESLTGLAGPAILGGGRPVGELRAVWPGEGGDPGTG